MQAAAEASTTSELNSTLLALAPDIGRALQHRHLLEQTDPAGQLAPPGSITPVERAAADTTLMVVQRTGGLPEEEARELLRPLSHMAPTCMQ